jgi:hypothetical protein
MGGGRERDAIWSHFDHLPTSAPDTKKPYRDKYAGKWHASNAPFAKVCGRLPHPPARQHQGGLTCGAPLPQAYLAFRCPEFKQQQPLKHAELLVQLREIPSVWKGASEEDRRIVDTACERHRAGLLAAAESADIGTGGSPITAASVAGSGASSSSTVADTCAFITGIFGANEVQSTIRSRLSETSRPSTTTCVVGHMQVGRACWQRMCTTSTATNSMP